MCRRLGNSDSSDASWHHRQLSCPRNLCMLCNGYYHRCDSSQGVNWNGKFQIPFPHRSLYHQPERTVVSVPAFDVSVTQCPLLLLPLLNSVSTPCVSSGHRPGLLCTLIYSISMCCLGLDQFRHKRFVLQWTFISKSLMQSIMIVMLDYESTRTS